MDTRDRILDAAARAFAEEGSRGATTRSIASAAGVNEVTLFRHFGSKQALLREALARASQSVAVAPLPSRAADPQRELTAWCTDHLQALYRARSLLRTSLGEHEANPAARVIASRLPMEVAAELEAYLRHLQTQGLCARDIDLADASALLMGALFTDAISRDIMPERFPHAPAEAARRYVTLFLRAIAPVRAGEPAGSRPDESEAAPRPRQPGRRRS